MFKLTKCVLQQLTLGRLDRCIAWEKHLEKLEDALVRKDCELAVREADLMLQEADQTNEKRNSFHVFLRSNNDTSSDALEKRRNELADFKDNMMMEKTEIHETLAAQHEEEQLLLNKIAKIAALSKKKRSAVPKPTSPALVISPMPDQKENKTKTEQEEVVDQEEEEDYVLQTHLAVRSPPRQVPPNKLKSRKYYAPTPKDIERHYQSIQVFGQSNEFQKRETKNNNIRTRLKINA